MREIIIAGTVCWDRLCRVPSMPVPGGYVEIDEVLERPGGEAINTAIALKTWGIAPAVYGNPIGMGIYAEKLRKSIETAGLRRMILPGGTMTTPLCDIYVTPDGDRTMFGVGFRELPELTKNLNVNFQRGGWFTCDMNFGDSARDLYQRAVKAGMRVYAMDIVGEAVLIGAGTIYQTSTDNAGERDNRTVNLAWVKETAERIGGLAILTDSSRGLFVALGESAAHLPAFPCPNLVDTTGAGDVFRAGMLWGLSHEHSLGQCLAFAAAAGALKCMHLGANSKLPVVEAIEAHINAHPQIASFYLPWTQSV